MLIIVKFRHFSKVECRFDIFAIFGPLLTTMKTQFCPFNNVKTSFDFVKGRNLLVRHCCQKTATMSKQHSTLSKESLNLEHSTMLLRHCCWCGRGFYKVACCFDNVAWTLLLVWTVFKSYTREMQMQRQSSGKIHPT